MSLDSNPVQLVKVLAPKLPLIGKTALLHTLNLSPTSRDWSLRTELTVTTIRSLMSGPKTETLSRLQRGSIRDPGVKGKLWVSKVTAPAPAEDDIRQALFEAIEAMKEPSAAPGGYTQPELLPVEAEWTGYRVGATAQSPDLRISEEAKYVELMKEVTSPTTILYFHGGGHFLLDPASHRPTTSELAKLTKGRAYSVRYRLSPQHPFPAAILDALVSYLTLLYPPPNSLHTPVSARHIVFAGDSAGGNVSFSLLQLLLQLRRENRTILFHGSERAILLPAGIATNSAWLDITHSTPSCTLNGTTDYLPTFPGDEKPTPYPPCAIWPASPPRNNIYAEDALLTHPFVSPLAAPPASWAGLAGVNGTKVLFGIGEELLTDENKIVAARIAGQGVVVRWEEWEKMPHCFALLLPFLPEAKRYMDGWAGFMAAVVEKPETVEGVQGVKFGARDLREDRIEVEKLSVWSEEEVRGWMTERVRKNAEPQGKGAKL